MSLNELQSRHALEALDAYLHTDRRNEDGVHPIEVFEENDRHRVEVINQQLLPLVQSYLQGKVELSDFKSQIDSINKRYEYWGFKGIKGQMFFNMVVNVADDLAECDQELKSAIALPKNEEIASSRIKTFESYVRRIGEELVNTGGSSRSIPKTGSIPFFLSYFWQIQDRTVWPVYYTNSVNMMVDLNLWQPTGQLAQDYIIYKHIHEELTRKYSEHAGKPFNLYNVEHVFWLKGGNPYGGTKPLSQDEDGPAESTDTPSAPVVEPMQRLPESYVPPIIAVLPKMAHHHDDLVEAARSSGTSLERAFEKHINAAFTILGYEAKLLGQGKGRVPDGVAVNTDDSYAIIWDAKIRRDGYSIGTDDRTIREYVERQSRDLKQRRRFRNIYYIIISSTFAEDYDDAIRGLKMESDVNEVVLLEAEALVAMVETKLRNPLELSLGPDGLQRLFCNSGPLTATTVREVL